MNVERVVARRIDRSQGIHEAVIRSSRLVDLDLDLSEQAARVRAGAQPKVPAEVNLHVLLEGREDRTLSIARLHDPERVGVRGVPRASDVHVENRAGSVPVPQRLRFAPELPRLGFSPADVLAAGLRHHHLANTAYPIRHRKTIWQHRVEEGEHARLLREALHAAPRMSLYAHVPFCEKRCRFCEYTVLNEHDSASEDRYFAALQGAFESIA